MSTLQTLIAQPLSEAAFAPYGRVLQAPPPDQATEDMNQGTARRLELVPDARLGAEGDRPVLAWVRAQARPLPLQLEVMERHRLGSQSFVPLAARLRFALVVARPGPAPAAGFAAPDLAVFVTDGAQGVWLAPGTWHHPLLALETGDFLVIERRSVQPDCDLAPLAEPLQLVLPALSAS